MRTRAHVLGSCLFGFVILQHFEFIAIAGFPVTGGLILGVVLFLLAGSRSVLLPGALALCGLLAIASVNALITPVGFDIVEWVRTLALFCFATIVITAAIAGEPAPELQSDVVRRVLLFLLVVTVALSVAQVAFGVMGSEALFNPFGDFQYLYQYEPYLQFNPVPRAQGFFLEPSYDAFIIGSISVWLFCIGRNDGVVAVLYIVGTLATQSATGLTIAAILVVLMALRRGIAAIGLTTIVIVVMYELVGSYVVGRLLSTSVEGSSANYRLEAPLKIMSDVLQRSLLGYPFGSIEDVVASYGLLNGSERGYSLDNGYYVLIYYFGWLALVLIAIVILSVLALLTKDFITTLNAPLRFVAPIWLAGSLMFSGGIMLPEFAVMFFLTVSFYRSSSHVPLDPQLDGGYGEALHSNRDIQ